MRCAAVTGSTGPGSDVDIGILPHADAQMEVRQQSVTAVELEDLLYFTDRNLADEYELYVLRRAGDLAPLERERLALLEGK